MGNPWFATCLPSRSTPICSCGTRGIPPKPRGAWPASTCRGPSSPGGRSTSSAAGRRASTRISRSRSPSTASPRSPRRSTGFEIYAIVEGRAVRSTRRRSPSATRRGCSTRRPALWRLDVMREPWEGDTWVCRRDPRIRRPGSEVIAFTADGIPYQQPEVALLFKAKHTREKDQADFEASCRCSARSRAWLAEALELVHPGHAWIGRSGRPSEAGSTGRAPRSRTPRRAAAARRRRGGRAR